jgi:glucose dehydrogenase
MQVSPLIVDGVMYTTAGVTRDVVALDAATGQLLWHWRPTGNLVRWFDIIEPLARSSGRGLTYWTDGHGDERIFVVMNNYCRWSVWAESEKCARRCDRCTSEDRQPHDYAPATIASICFVVCSSAG